jgi:exodeoxyribonuclease VII small subunit
MADDEKFEFKTAMDEIEKILKGIESNQVSVDELVDHVSRATDLLQKCRAKLRDVETQVIEVVQTVSQ